MIASVARRLGFREADCAHVALALDEALCNVIKHGYEKRDDQRIWISVWPLHGSCCGIRILIEDRGRQVEPDEIRSRQLDDIRPGGLGVHIINQVMDEVQYAKRAGGGMSLLLEKHLPAENAPSLARKETA